MEEEKREKENLRKKCEACREQEKENLFLRKREEKREEPNEEEPNEEEPNEEEKNKSILHFLFFLFLKVHSISINLTMAMIIRNITIIIFFII